MTRRRLRAISGLIALTIAGASTAHAQVEEGLRTEYCTFGASLRCLILAEPLGEPKGASTPRVVIVFRVPRSLFVGAAAFDSLRRMGRVMPSYQYDDRGLIAHQTAGQWAAALLGARPGRATTLLIYGRPVPIPVGDTVLFVFTDSTSRLGAEGRVTLARVSARFGPSLLPRRWGTDDSVVTVSASPDANEVLHRFIISSVPGGRAFLGASRPARVTQQRHDTTWSDSGTTLCRVPDVYCLMRSGVDSSAVSRGRWVRGVVLYRLAAVLDTVRRPNVNTDLGEFSSIEPQPPRETPDTWRVIIGRSVALPRRDSTVVVMVQHETDGTARLTTTFLPALRDSRLWTKSWSTGDTSFYVHSSERVMTTLLLADSTVREFLRPRRWP